MSYESALLFFPLTLGGESLTSLSQTPPGRSQWKTLLFPEESFLLPKIETVSHCGRHIWSEMCFGFSPKQRYVDGSQGEADRISEWKVTEKINE